MCKYMAGGAYMPPTCPNRVKLTKILVTHVFNVKLNLKVVLFSSIFGYQDSLLTESQKPKNDKMTERQTTREKD